MRHIPILFSTAMVQAKLNRIKTQTRRVLKKNSTALDWIKQGFTPEYVCDPGNSAICPYGAIGDVLWTRESVHNEAAKDETPIWIYKTDNPIWKICSGGSWTPSIHMPKTACRMWDVVKGIRIEQVASISRQDCLAEGIREEVELEDTKHEKTYYTYEFGGPRFDSAYAAYKALWQKINGKPSAIQSKVNGKTVTSGYIIYPFDDECGAEWKDKNTFKGKPLQVIINPWVWVIEFEPCNMPDDFLTTPSLEAKSIQ